MVHPSKQTGGGDDVYVGNIPGPSGFSLSAGLVTALIIAVALAAFGFRVIPRTNRFRLAAEAPGGAAGSAGPAVEPGQRKLPEQDARPFANPEDQRARDSSAREQRDRVISPRQDSSGRPQGPPPELHFPRVNKPTGNSPSLAERMHRLAGASAKARSPIDQSGGYAEVDGLILWSVPAVNPAAAPQVFIPGDELYVLAADESTACLTVTSRQ